MTNRANILAKLTEQQNNCCAICGNEFNYKRKRKLDIDYNGNVCGLLCADCKAGIEAFNRDPSLINKAIGVLNRMKGLMVNDAFEVK